MKPAVFRKLLRDMNSIKNKSGGKTVSLAEEAKKNGGTLNMEQMMRLAEASV